MQSQMAPENGPTSTQVPTLHQPVLEQAAEEWRPIVGYENLYQVSNLGGVRRFSDWFAMSFHIGNGGYKNISLYKNGGKKRFRVHRVVMASFVGPCPHEMEVNHMDGNKSNNRVENLEYVSGEQNKLHAIRMGLIASGDRNGTRTHPESVIRGEKSGQSKLTEDDVLEIRKSFGFSMRCLARKYNVSKSTIEKVLHGFSWKHVYMGAAAGVVPADNDAAPTNNPRMGAEAGRSARSTDAAADEASKGAASAPPNNHSSQPAAPTAGNGRPKSKTVQAAADGLSKTEDPAKVGDKEASTPSAPPVADRAAQATAQDSAEAGVSEGRKATWARAARDRSGIAQGCMSTATEDQVRNAAWFLAEVLQEAKP
jgi:DNA-binding transcriptional regulator YiaG